MKEIKASAKTSFFNFQIRVIKNRVYLKGRAREQGTLNSSEV